MNEIFLSIGMCFIQPLVMQCVSDMQLMGSNHECQMKAAELNQQNKDLFHTRLNPAEYGVEVPKKTPHGVEFDPAKTQVKFKPVVCKKNEDNWIRKVFKKKGPFKKGETLREWWDPIYH